MSKVKFRRYGVCKTIRNKLIPYVSTDCRDSGPDRFPEKEGYEVIKESIEYITHEEAERNADIMLGEIECPVLRTLNPGDIAHHSDRQGSHQAIVLEISGDMVKGIFFTSSSGFGERRATDEELGCAGFGNSRETYIAPVERPLREFTSEGKKFPEYRVKELMAEFFS